MLEEDLALQELQDELSRFAARRCVLSDMWVPGFMEAARYFVKSVYRQKQPKWAFQLWRVRTKLEREPGAVLASLHDEHGNTTPSGLWNLTCNKYHHRAARRSIFQKRVHMYNWYINFNMPVQLRFHSKKSRHKRRSKAFKLPRPVKKAS